jgi:hypothetical protein
VSKHRYSVTIARHRISILACTLVLFGGGRRELRGQAWDLIIAALASVNADSSNTVLVDQTVLGVPQFALSAYSSIRRGDTALARAVEPQLQSLNRARRPIPACLVTERHWRAIADSALLPLFRARDGWNAFHAQYGPGSQFALISQPLIAGDTATIVVATASGDLAGRGVLRGVTSRRNQRLKRLLRA